MTTHDDLERKIRQLESEVKDCSRKSADLANEYAALKMKVDTALGDGYRKGARRFGSLYGVLDSFEETLQSHHSRLGQIEIAIKKS